MWGLVLFCIQPQAAKQYEWIFLSGLEWPQGYNQNIGKPDNLRWSRDEYSDEFFHRIDNALPEQELNEAFITDDAGSTIYLTEAAEVFVTFIHEERDTKNLLVFLPLTQIIRANT